MSTLTVEGFWRSVHGKRVVWRTARKKEHRCGECRGTIAIGNRYLDTGAPAFGGVWQTVKCCGDCAAKPTNPRVFYCQNCGGQLVIRERGVWHRGTDCVSCRPLKTADGFIEPEDVFLGPTAELRARAS